MRVEDQGLRVESLGLRVEALKLSVEISGWRVWHVAEVMQEEDAAGNPRSSEPSHLNTLSP